MTAFLSTAFKNQKKTALGYDSTASKGAVLFALSGCAKASRALDREQCDDITPSSRTRIPAPLHSLHAPADSQSSPGHERRSQKQVYPRKEIKNQIMFFHLQVPPSSFADPGDCLNFYRIRSSILPGTPCPQTHGSESLTSSQREGRTIHYGGQARTQQVTDGELIGQEAI